MTTATDLDAPNSSPPPAPDGAPRSKASSILDAIMGNPLVGLSPWILYSLVEGNGRLELSAALALGLAFVVLVVNWLRGGTPKLLEYTDVVYFAALAVIVAFASEGTRTWLELWGGEVANIALLVIVAGSLLIRQPFTLQYAREDTPEEYWHTPEFLKVNYQITWAWAAAFLIQAASGFYGDAVLDNSNNIWTGWIIQTLPLIIAAQFTIWYPNRLEAVRDGRKDAPTVADFLATITPWITIIGIISLSTDGGPEWLGIGLIVVGIGLTKALAGASSTKTAA
ncbi:MAG TPA: hypothetical protein VIY72_05905 [Acidimicrobiales bacterium]